MAKVIWTKKAFGQLERAIKYIKEEQGRSYAEIVLNKILTTTETLEHSTKAGTVEPLLKHKKSEYRFLVVWSYKIIYRLGKDKVVISRVFHTSRNPKYLKGI
ncbi:MAG: type II toxin-antitoxin system RelE/ParE family toxin [Chitinophagales bacterium]